MIIYHGGMEIVDTPRIITSEIGRDFGPGFYTTDIETQAERWARRKALASGRFISESKAVLNIYEFDETAYVKLKTLHFPEISIEWLDMVIACRSDSHYSHGCDIVTGKTANDNVGETVEYVLRNIMRKEDALDRLKFEKINNQICFCTDVALGFVKFREARML